MAARLAQIRPAGAVHGVQTAHDDDRPRTRKPLGKLASADTSFQLLALLLSARDSKILPDVFGQQMPNFTFYFEDKLPIAVIGHLLEAIEQFDLRTRPFLRFEKHILLNVFGSTLLRRAEKVSARIRLTERVEREMGEVPRLSRARFDSPGFITVDGSGALEKIIDILHQGDLAKEERKALIDRIQAEATRIDAETDRTTAEAARTQAEAALIRAQAGKQRVETLSGAISALQSLGFEPAEIRELIARRRTTGSTGSYIFSAAGSV